MKHLVFILALLLSSPAWGYGEWKSCDSGVPRTSFSGGVNALCVDLDPTNAVTDSAILSVSQCDNIDVIYEGNMAADTAAPNTSVQIQSCVSSAVSANTCKPIDNVTLTGAHTSFEILGAAAVWIYVDETTDPQDQTPRVVVKCNRSNE